MQCSMTTAHHKERRSLQLTRLGKTTVMSLVMVKIRDYGNSSSNSGTNGRRDKDNTETEAIIRIIMLEAFNKYIKLDKIHIRCVIMSIGGAEISGSVISEYVVTNSSKGSDVTLNRRFEEFLEE